ncbi:WD40 repeat protein [Saccharothrix tamanrassetensis]|uniref:WD40 repeat protein n=1 Tax=Saccharothrix tamanrassetensis TaxID=1051531 RepID=A0A841CT52_9PSEU|nr:helix-turn-helix domain-containing protein [Saccharothrix tamanrassetensis]MBB5959328.1 WD40 repeat protein [Saccharothrix tamanrassetensis]
MTRRESPLREDAGALGEFAQQLRRLREQAGSPTYRQLSRHAHYSAAALSEAANGRKLPSLAVTLAYVRACGGDVAGWEARWRELAAAVNPPAEPSGTPPYAGLAAFQVDDADRFFGRDRLVNELTGLVARRRFVGVFGASGSGKSSVLRAGLVARARRPAVVFTPGARPVEELAVHLAAFTGKTAGALADEFAAYPENLHLRVRQQLVGSDDDLLLVVDQFEEVFTLCRDTARQHAFVAALTGAATTPTSRTRVVLGVRADFLGHCGRYPELVEALRGGHVLVGPMDADELREAIVEPALAVGCKAETALVTRLVADAVGRPAVLPLVSHALLETWRRRRGVALTLAGYQEAGGVEHSIARSAEAVYLGMGDRQRAVAKEVFLRLIAVGEGTEDTKRRVARDEVDHPEVLAVLADARLVVLDRDTVELAHEALIHRWPRLRDWIAEDRAGLRVQRLLTEAARMWESLDRDPGSLYRGTRLALAREWAAGAGARMTPAEVRFLDASIRAEAAVTATEFRRTRRLRQLIGVMGVLLLLASVSTFLAFQAERRANEQRNIAVARKVLNEAATLRETHPALALQLTLAAHRLAPLDETRDALFDSFATPYATRIEGVRNIEVSLARSLMAAVDADVRGDARLYDLSDPRRPARRGALTGHVGGVDDLAFSPDGRTIATAGGYFVRVWDAADAERPAVVHKLTHPTITDNPVSVTFSPSGRYLAVGYQDHPPVLWDLAAAPQPVLTAPFTGGRSRAVAFLTDDVLLAADGTHARAWRLAERDAPVEFTPSGGRVHTIAVSDDRRTVATVDAERAVDVWDLTDPGRPVRLATVEHTDAVMSAAFGAGGRTLITGGADRTAKLWDLADRNAPVALSTLNGHLGGVMAVAFAGDGRVVATVGTDGIARLVDVTDLPLTQPTKVRSTAVSSDRGIMATVDVEGVLRLLDISEPRVPRTAWPLRHPGRVRTAALSPDGEHLVTVGEDDSVVRVWRTTNPAAPDLVGEFPDGWSVAFAPTGAFFAVGGATGGIHLRDTTTLEVLATLREPGATGNPQVFTSPVGALAFRHDGARLAVARWNGRVEEWDVSDPARPVDRSGLYPPSVQVASLAIGPAGELLTVEEQGGAVLWRQRAGASDAEMPPVRLVTDARSVAVSGRYAAVAGADGKVRLFDVSDAVAPRERAVFSGHAGESATAAFAADGHTLVSAGGSVVRFWETDADRVEARICATAYPRLTAEAWRHYFQDLPFTPPCP